jgi:hypothetical protein
MSVRDMHDNTQIGGGPVSTNPGPAWQAIGTGDFNQDGFADILLQNKNTGAVSVWEMHDNTQIGGGPVANPGLNWHAIGTGAGGSDILLQKVSGQTSIWEMDGNMIAGGGPVTHSRLELASGRADLTPHNRRERLRVPEAGAIRSTHRPPWLRA